MCQAEAVQEVAGKFAAGAGEILSCDAMPPDGPADPYLRQDGDREESDGQKGDNPRSPSAITSKSGAAHAPACLRTSTNCCPVELVQFSCCGVTSAQFTLDVVWRMIDVTEISIVRASA